MKYRKATNQNKSKQQFNNRNRKVHVKNRPTGINQRGGRQL